MGLGLFAVVVERGFMNLLFMILGNKGVLFLAAYVFSPPWRVILVEAWEPDPVGEMDRRCPATPR